MKTLTICDLQSPETPTYDKIGLIFIDFAVTQPTITTTNQIKTKQKHKKKTKNKNRQHCQRSFCRLNCCR